MTATYDRLGLRFQYPENWELTDDTDDESPRRISVQSPTGAFWSLDVYPFSVQTKEILDSTLKTMRSEYPELEEHATSEEIAGEEAVGYDLYFQYLDFIVSARLRCLRYGHATYMLTYQAEDRDFDVLKEVFRAMTFSLFQDESS